MARELLATASRAAISLILVSYSVLSVNMVAAWCQRKAQLPFPGFYWLVHATLLGFASYSQTAGPSFMNLHFYCPCDGIRCGRYAAELCTRGGGSWWHGHPPLLYI